MQQIGNQVEFEQAVQAPGLTVAVFKADWCGDCKFIEPFMPEVEEKYAHALKLIQVDVEQVEGVSEAHHVLGIPSFIAFSNGQEVVRLVNRLRKSRAEIEQFLDRAVEVQAALKA